MTQEFHLSITPIRSNEYLVRTEEVASGVPLAEEQYEWPTDDWLSQARQLMNDPIVGLLQSDHLSSSDQQSSSINNHSEVASNLVTLGQQLYSNLFQGRLRDSWMTAQGIAQHRGEALRLRLGLKGRILPGIPWEVLNGGVGQGFHLSTQHVATGVNILFSRYLADAGMSGAIAYPVIPKPQKTIKILMAIAAPTDQQQLKLNQEAHHLQEELRLKANVLQAGNAHLLPDIRVTILEQPGREELAQALEQGQYNIFHYAGHSDLGSAGGQLYLVNRQTGLSETLSGNDLAGLLLNNDIQMAVFNSCRGAHTATASSNNQQQTGTLTDALINLGIPAVLAMAEQIPDDVALSLTRLFYRNLKQGYPVDLSLSRARQGLLSAYSSDQLYWALPILYLNREFDGYLTEGDRALDNPADSLIRLPHLHASPLSDAVTDVTQAPGRPPGETVVTHPTSSSAFTGQTPHSSGQIHQEGSPYSLDENLANVNDTTIQTDESSSGYLEPKDAPVLDEKPELPNDFFLADDGLNRLDTDATDDGESVRDLVEQLEGGHTETEAIASVSNAGYGSNNENTGNGTGKNTASRAHDSDSYMIHDADDESHHSNEHLNAVSSDMDIFMSNQDTSNTENGIDNRAEHAPYHSSHSSQLPTEGSASHLATVRSQQNLDEAPESSSFVDPALLKQRQSSSWKKLLWLPVASVAGAAVVFLGYRFIPPITLSSNPQEILADVTRTNLPDKATDRISEFGIVSFNQNNLEDGEAAIIELLNRGELDKATAVLDSVPQEQGTDPMISFLQGRLAWQYSIQNNPTYSVQDASQFWSYAAQKSEQPSEQPLYYNALGFALYSEGRLEDAIEAWETALITLDDSGIDILPDDNGHTLSSQGSNPIRVGVPQRPLSNQDALTAYSGIALAMTQLSASLAVEQPYDLLSQAVQIRQIVLQSADGVNPDMSEHAWLWTDALTQEWEIFKGVSSQ